MIKHAVYLAPFDQLAHPAVLADVAVAAEEAGWEGLFLWDHVLRPVEQTRDIADVWISLAAIACRTDRLRIGPMVTPLVRRRVAKLARETVTLDQLSNGRLIFGVGLGVDSGRELSAFGEDTDPRARARHTDEAITALHGLWSGERTRVHGQHVWVDGVTFLPRPVQRPRIPTWFAARGDALAPARRAGRTGDGLFPIEIDRYRLGRMLDAVAEERGSLNGFDVAVRMTDGPLALADLGVTWIVHDFAPDVSVEAVLRHIERAERITAP